MSVEVLKGVGESILSRDGARSVNVDKCDSINDTQRRILCFSLFSDKLLRRFDSIKEAEMFLKVPHGSRIPFCCDSIIKSAYGFKWEYDDDVLTTASQNHELNSSQESEQHSMNELLPLVTLNELLEHARYEDSGNDDSIRPVECWFVPCVDSSEDADCEDGNVDRSPSKKSSKETILLRASTAFEMALFLQSSESADSREIMIMACCAGLIPRALGFVWS